MSNGLFLYDEKHHQLIQKLPFDIRSNIGIQKMMHSAPVGIIYVSDFTKLKTFIFKNDDRKWFTSTTDSAFISQNIYLYCAAANLNTVLLSLVDRAKLHSIMRLNENEKVVYTQGVGKSLDS